MTRVTSSDGLERNIPLYLSLLFCFMRCPRFCHLCTFTRLFKKNISARFTDWRTSSVFQYVVKFGKVVADAWEVLCAPFTGDELRAFLELLLFTKTRNPGDEQPVITRSGAACGFSKALRVYR